jgi:hypothetical protein
MSPVPYPTWSLTVSLPASTMFQYKYVKIDQAGNITWENSANRTLMSPAIGTAAQSDAFQP